ncbi:MAG TPA: S4 domain-containing protein YaaA [Acetivibrio saccincola]|jgi:ribosome-associated protein|uniref:S4 domain-containing protein YaaA n=1 Tax=Acetivibrio saccincola TaxID=1677857 RepID=UPI002CC8B5B4|nr:S4 domain-containing protein YaaA [Acetivibrio saccincola]HOA97878.1 S4 domain-containing protein YaaA [Acetivibrio saccincola]HQD28928.1 S4 domain-containing protein YaaA [Acetivibrio saccincola]
MKDVRIETEYIKLGQFLKWVGIADTGAESKELINESKVKVNGQVELRRGKKLRKGDIIELGGNKYRIVD